MPCYYNHLKLFNSMETSHPTSLFYYTIHQKMLILLISFLSFILVSKSFLKPFWGWNWKRQVKVKLAASFPRFWIAGSKSAGAAVVGEEELGLLDLPDLALECVLHRLSPAGLCSMAAVSASLREMCTSDHMWEKHMAQKWGRLIADAAQQKWQCYIASKRRNEVLVRRKRVARFWGNRSKQNEASLPQDSVMARYLAIENGDFWFPAQVLNRENGLVGFMLSSYDAELNYDSTADNFTARYSVNGRRTIEENIGWNRIRAPGVDTPPYDLHVSDCLNDLKPGDHIEIQWRRNKDFPYGWWYGVVGHMELCNGCDTHCQCHLSDTVALEFKQYNPASRWRQTTVNRKDHREVGNGADGFYGGIRKLHTEQDISMWKCLWPAANI